MLYLSRVDFFQSCHLDRWFDSIMSMQSKQIYIKSVQKNRDWKLGGHRSHSSEMYILAVDRFSFFLCFVSQFFVVVIWTSSRSLFPVATERLKTIIKSIKTLSRLQYLSSTTLSQQSTHWSCKRWMKNTHQTDRPMQRRKKRDNEKVCKRSGLVGWKQRKENCQLK